MPATVGADRFDTRAAWVDFVTAHFSSRTRQRVEPLGVRVTPLAADLSLMTSEEESEMWLKGGESVRSRLVFTMIWKKERDGWKIVHSHESWVDEGPN